MKNQPSTQSAIPTTGYIRRFRLAEMLGISLSTLDRKVRNGSLPKPTKLGEHNTASGSMASLDSPRGRAQFVGKSLIIMPDQTRYVGEGAGIKAITGGDPVEIDALHRLQDKERQKSPLGIAPTIHEIARSIMSKALAEIEGATA